MYWQCRVGCKKSIPKFKVDHLLQNLHILIQLLVAYAVCCCTVLLKSAYQITLPAFEQLSFIRRVALDAWNRRNKTTPLITCSYLEYAVVVYVQNAVVVYFYQLHVVVHRLRKDTYLSHLACMPDTSIHACCGKIC